MSGEEAAAADVTMEPAAPEAEKAPAEPAAPEVPAEPEPAAEPDYGPTVKIQAKASVGGVGKLALEIGQNAPLTKLLELASVETKVPANELRVFLKGKRLEDVAKTVTELGLGKPGQTLLFTKGPPSGAAPAAAAKKEEPKKEEPKEPEVSVPCKGGCGFFGTTRTEGYCSKCYNIELERRKKEKGEEEKKVEEVKKAEEEAAKPPEPERPKQENKERCWKCNKKVGMTGFECRCGYIFCSTHRYAEDHACDFDFRTMQQEKLRKANPLVAADKLGR